jgi:hypothetical protein
MAWALRTSFFVLALSAAANFALGQSPTPNASSVVRADVLKVTKSADAVEVKLRLPNEWTTTVYVGVCDTPARLSGITAYLERFADKAWRRVKPPTGVVHGDLPPTSLEIKPGADVELPFGFRPAFFGLTAGDTVRIVVLVRTEGGAMGIGVKSPKLITKPFSIPSGT